ncbi:MAG: hypothetical protein MI757_05020 [Pirellulales bacterium]|nr:hypothetical protein [Pirellulales bacterium]
MEQSLTKPVASDLNTRGHATTMGLAILAVAIVSGCASDAKEAKRDSPAANDQKSTDVLVAGLEEESETVRRASLDELESLLKRRIYFDPAAPASERKQQLEDVRAMWENLKDRNLVEAAKQRAPLQYFYDLHTGELFEDRDVPGPIETRSGAYEGMPAGVRAVVFACRDCGDDRYVAWLQVPVAELERLGVAYEVGDASAAPSNQQVEGEPGDQLAIRDPDGGPWLLMRSSAGQQIVTVARRCADRPHPIFCRPGR